jgi:hypothetical protein
MVKLACVLLCTLVSACTDAPALPTCAAIGCTQQVFCTAKHVCDCDGQQCTRVPVDAGDGTDANARPSVDNDGGVGELAEPADDPSVGDP